MEDPLNSVLACSLVGKSETVSITRGSLAHRAYERDSTAEQFLCNLRA